MNIIFAGGGTAGHVTPAIAIAEEIKEKYKNSKITFIGRSGGFENELIKKADIPIFTLEISGLSRNFCLENIKRLKKAHAASKRAMEILCRNIVYGTHEVYDITDGYKGLFGGIKRALKKHL